MARENLEKLLRVIIPTAQHLLKKHKVMYPMGAVLNKEGEVLFAQPQMASEHPESRQVINELLRVFREQAQKQEIIATVICYDGKVTPPDSVEKTDAICAELEDVNGDAMAIFLPYKRNLFGRQKYQVPFACAGEIKIFK